MAGVPVADYVAAYEDEMEPLRAYDRALFGGSPHDVPDAYRDSSPITYVDDVRAPVLILAGENDPRCPIRQIDNYLDALAERGKSYARLPRTTPGTARWWSPSGCARWPARSISSGRRWPPAPGP